MKNRLNKARHSLFPSNNGLWTGILYCILTLPILFALILSSDLEGSIVKKMAYLSMSLLLLSLPAIVLKARWYFIVQGIFVLLAPLEITHLLLNKMPVSIGFITAIIQTNVHESLELLMTFKWIALLIALCWLLYFFAVSKVKNSYLLTTKAKLILITLFVLMNGGLYVSMYLLTSKMDPVDVRLKLAGNKTLMKYNKIYPSNLFQAIRKSLEKEHNMALLTEKLKGFKFHTTAKDTLTEKEIYVVVIGESARYANFSINGYHKKTSPNLEKTKNLISFSDVYSTANITETILPLLLTRATPLNEEPIYTEKTFVDAFKEAGFSTSWIANQSGGNPYIARIAKETDYAYFTTVDFDANANYDGNLLPYIDKVIDKNQLRTCIVIHTLGSHFRYNFRHPASFAHFQPCLEGTVDYSIISPKNKEQLINAYDNTILYTDYFLSSIIQRVKKENAISSIVYISDHAESLYDEGKKMIMHGRSFPTVYEIHVPLFVWTSDQYQETFPEKCAHMRLNRDKKLSSSNLFHSILDIANLSYPKEERKYSIASETFIEDSVRYVQSTSKEIITFN